jgi:hypothetical protein
MTTPGFADSARMLRASVGAPAAAAAAPSAQPHAPTAGAAEGLTPFERMRAMVRSSCMPDGGVGGRMTT